MSNIWKIESLGMETRKAHPRRIQEGFFDKYCQGIVLDIGYRGYEDNNAVPVVPHAIGVDLNFPGYDGKTLPFPSESIDAVYNSHTLEHINDYVGAIKDWFRVLKVGGYLIVTVPHQFLYEKKMSLPSNWNGDHKRFYTPKSLLSEIEESLEFNTYRVRRLLDDDEGFDYTVPADRHSSGGYQIEIVIQKIKRPDWSPINNNVLVDKAYGFLVRVGLFFRRCIRKIIRIFKFL